MSNRDLLHTLFRYQSWADDDLLAKLADLESELAAERRLTALRLINHNHVVAQIFAAHLVGARHHFLADNTAETPPLEQLRPAVAASNHWYLAYLETLTAERLAEAIPFSFTDGDKGCMTRAEMLTHVVVHGTYHRGEAGRLLTQQAITPPWDTFAVYLHRSEPARRLAVRPEPIEFAQEIGARCIGDGTVMPAPAL